MFFRRQKTKASTFDERKDALRAAGFAVESRDGGATRVSRNGCAAEIEDQGGPHPQVHKAGVLIGNEIGWMVHGGFQMFFRTPSGRTEPAIAEQLHALHDFEEDLKEALGLVSLYNESLGTTADQHLYDRVVQRDSKKRRILPWKRQPALTK